MENKKCILLGSGGLDSQISMGILNDQGYEIEVVYFDYDQKTKIREIPALEKYTQSILRKKPKIISLADYTQFIQSNWAITGDVEQTFNNKEKIFIPGRNIVFLLYSAIMGYYSESYKLVLSLHKSDSISGDCKPDFCTSFQHSLSLGMSTPSNPLTYEIITPLKDLHKHEAIKIGHQLGLNMGDSWSCDHSLEKHCGECNQCIERKHMFQLAGVSDLTEYLK